MANKMSKSNTKTHTLNNTQFSYLFVKVSPRDVSKTYSIVQCAWIFCVLFFSFAVGLLRNRV